MVYKPPISDNLVIKRIRSVTQNNNYPESVSYVLSNLFLYMRKKDLVGACHALSSTLYVCLSEIGLKPQLLIGECQKPGDKPFDHSWIVLDNKILDLAIYMPLTMLQGSSDFQNTCLMDTGPVIFNIDIQAMKRTSVSYGINTGLPMQDETLFPLNAPFCEYMSRFPMEYGGLWTVVQNVLPSDVKFDREKAIARYSDVERIFVR